MSYSSNLSAVPAADDEDFVVDDSDYLADRADRSGLPVIPRAAPKHGDTIDVESIKREFATRAVRRSSPSANADSIELTSIPAALPRDNDDDNDEGELDEFEYSAPERRATRARLPRKTFLTAAFLLGVGVIFSTLGLSFLFTLGLNEALPFLIIGGIGFIPGSYVSFIIYQTWKGVPGYSYDQIPSYDD